MRCTNCGLDETEGVELVKCDECDVIYCADCFEGHDCIDEGDEPPDTSDDFEDDDDILLMR